MKPAWAAWNWHDFNVNRYIKDFNKLNDSIVLFGETFFFGWINKMQKSVLWLKFTFHIQRIYIHFKMQNTMLKYFNNSC